ncbi:MAG: aminotransferase class I/II-fold pyridoxal phosphate-dependent enzyme, partial [Dinghuibacter sp.]|nr:aminotransferase class I/II-fold pyridoxal phosphate-dependent enzyme [Dinghuibacter sp.]
MQTAGRLNGIGEYYFSQKLREIEELNKTGERVINLGIGSPDLPPHPDVIAALHTESSNPAQHAYQSYRGVPTLRVAVANWYRQWYGVQLDAGTEILPLMGSKEGIMHICMTYLGPGDMALVPNPGYPAYAAAVQLAGAQAVYYSLSEAGRFQPSLQQLEQLVQQHGNIKLLFLNYPHMPTGELPSKAVLEQLVAFARQQGILLVHDNPYSFILNEEPFSILSIPGA